MPNPNRKDMEFARAAGLEQSGPEPMESAAHQTRAGNARDGVRPATVYGTRRSPKVAVLFATADSVYKDFPICDVYDKERDALSWNGGMPVIAHPPCRAWGRLRRFARTEPGEMCLALWAVQRVRQFGGVLEHPFASTLWSACDLPKPGSVDRFGGWTLAMPQFWLGHKADKATWFYIVGVPPDDIEIPFRLGEAEFVVQTRKRERYKKHIPKRERERTPRECAEFLIDLALRVLPVREQSPSGSERTSARGQSPLDSGSKVAGCV